MTKINKAHPMIDREALMAGIAAMKVVKKKEKENFTQKEAVEMTAEAARHLLGQGYSLAEVVAVMKDKSGLTLGEDTVRSYLRTAKAANDVAAQQKPGKRRGQKSQPAATIADAPHNDAG